MSPAHLHQYATSLVSPGQLSESLPASQVHCLYLFVTSSIKMVNPKWRASLLKIDQICLKLATWGFGGAEFEFDIIFNKFKMADPK